MEVEPLLVFCLAVNLFTSRPWTTSISIHKARVMRIGTMLTVMLMIRRSAGGQCVDPWSGSAANGH